uniref:OmpA family protein n=1 Tax=Roseihalotalea indica TaxID=2867963 RepID=A0AA49JIF2_9BACT|nr:OmpA family protein [Tunicatimonas sp. TK19036]
MRRYCISLCILLLSTVIYAQDIQWASKVVRFSSEFNYDKFPQQYRADQALGTPSVLSGFGSTPCAFTPSTQNKAEGEYIEVGFANPQPVQQVFINENFNAGSVQKVELVDIDSNYHMVFEEANPASVGGGRLLKVSVARTAYEVSGVKVTMKTSIDGEYNQIDAIGIADFADNFDIKINEVMVMDTLVREHLSDKVNSEFDELCPVISPDGKVLYYSRVGHPQNIVTDKQNIWVCELDSVEHKEAYRFPEPINGKSNSALLSMTPDGQKALLLNIYHPDGSSDAGISFTEKTADGWSFPVEVPVENFYNNNAYGEYSLSNSGNVMIAAIERNDTYGSKDLYVIQKVNDTLWAEPQHLGAILNTADSEMSPFLAADDRTLYFASAGFPGYGSKDIFMSKRLGDGWLEWSEPVNLGNQLNTPKWDAYYTTPADGSYVYFISYEESSLGKGDIYRAKMPESLKPSPIVLVQGVVRSQKDESFISSEIIYHSLSKGVEVGRAQSDPNTGAYKIVLPAGDNYGFSATKDGYIPVSASMDLTQVKKYEEVERDLYLTPIEEGARIVINNLYFDTNKYDIRESSFFELNQLADIMKRNPGMKVLIGGHTDSDGNDAANKLLSKNRAIAVKEHLTQLGIVSDRLLAEGYGETTPIAENTSAESKQKNRRVEFIVTGMDK